MKLISKYTRWLFIALLATILAACGGGGNCTNCTVTPATNYALGTLPNGSEVWTSTENLTITNGTSTTSTVGLTGGAAGESYELSFIPTLKATGKTKNVTYFNGLIVQSTPERCILIAGTGNTCQLLVDAAHAEVGTYTITTYYKQANSAESALPQVITVIVSATPTPTPTPTPVAGSLSISPLTSSSVSVGSDTTATVSLVGSSEVTTPVSVAIASDNSSIVTLSPSRCSLTTTNNSCLVTLHGASAGTGTFNAGASGYSSVISPTLTVVAPASITITPSTVNPAISASGYFTLSLSLVGSVSADQTVSISNSAALQALGVLVVSEQSDNLTSCILNDNTPTCIFNVVASGQTLANATPPDIMLSNGGSATLNPASQSYTLTAAASFTGTIKLPQTGQTAIYSAYDDANFLTGYPWVNNAGAAVTPATRFTDDGCEVTDHLTGLIWLKDPTVASPTALTWASSLTTANTGTWCGQSAGAWRVPNINELYSLVNFGESNIANWLNSAGHFNSIAADKYWSSSTRSNNTGAKWYVNLSNGIILSWDQSNASLLLPVRGTTAGLASIPQTGESQTAPLDPAPTGSDGNLMKGAAWPNPRFTVGTGATADCITDNLTGLTWLRDGNLANAGATLTWDSAIRIASNGSWCGYSDWRLPNIREMMSLTNYSQQFATWLTDAGFTNLSVTMVYWSSTTQSGVSNKAWATNIKQGAYTTIQPKTAGNGVYMLPVRGGVGADG